MKRLVVVLAGLLVLPAFAEVAPAYYYDEFAEFVDDDLPAVSDLSDVQNDNVATPESDTAETAPAPATNNKATTPSPRNATSRANATRAISGNPSSRAVTSRANSGAARTLTSRTNTNTASRARTTVARSQNTATTSAQPTTASRNATQSSTQHLTTRQSANKSGTTAARASIVQTDTVNTPLYNGRIGVRNVSARVPTIRMSSTGTTETTTTTAAQTATEMDELAQITDFCKAQYTQCMDNFCNVLDDNQGRCSCSKNLEDYSKTESALKQATEDLQDVAQKIQYIGLTADEVETLFTQTEAELEMQSKSDNTQLKNDLDKIKSLIIDVKTANARSSESSIGMDLSGLLDFTIDSTGFDLSSFLGTSSSTASISNQRGEQLYKTASARCKASVLNSCSAQGVDISVITNAYDLEIDKQCILYERSLTDANDQMVSTVRNAKSVLQKARLLVAQQKNQYDLRECINELDNCMQDDYVCGDEYENCLDPSGKYIVNGEIVAGSAPGQSGDAKGNLYKDAWKYSSSGDQNAWGEGGTLAAYVDATKMKSAAEFKTSHPEISKFLQSKIGYHDDSDGKNYGMCMSVLNKCQDITYSDITSKQKYVFDNNVISEYLQRTLVQIKAKQDEILADYAESCTSDVISCLSQNNFDADEEKNNTITSAVNKVAVNACNSIITTCISVNGITGETGGKALSTQEWVLKLMGANNN